MLSPACPSGGAQASRVLNQCHQLNLLTKKVNTMAQIEQILCSLNFAFGGSHIEGEAMTINEFMLRECGRNKYSWKFVGHSWSFMFNKKLRDVYVSEWRFSLSLSSSLMTHCRFA